MKLTTAMLWAFALGMAPTGWAAAQSEGYPPAGQPPFQPQPQPIYGEQQANPSYPVPYNPEGDAIDDGGEYQPDDPDAEQQVAADNQAAEAYDDGYDPQAYTQFEGALSPYGSWVDDPTYGRIWSPSTAIVGAGFVPYGDGGRWVQSEYGWTWVSQWDWGWAPFHYGRWVSGASGWGWVPGRVWGPGWVSWRYGGGYAGWAALPPRGVRIGPPTGTRNAWRFVVGTQIGAPRPAFLPANVVPSVLRANVGGLQRADHERRRSDRAGQRGAVGANFRPCSSTAQHRAAGAAPVQHHAARRRAGGDSSLGPLGSGGAERRLGRATHDAGEPRLAVASSDAVVAVGPDAPGAAAGVAVSPGAGAFVLSAAANRARGRCSCRRAPPRRRHATTVPPHTCPVTARTPLRTRALPRPLSIAPLRRPHPRRAPTYAAPSHVSAPSYSAPPSHSSGGGGHHR